MLRSDDNPTILIIDDDVANLKLAVECLRAYGYEVLFARDGETGVERAKMAKPDLVLLDVGLPGIDGFEVSRRLAAARETRNTPVIFMTGHTGLEDRIRGFDVGGVDYVTKPFERRELLARVQAHVEIRQQRRQLQHYAEMLRERAAGAREIAATEKRRRYKVESEAETLRSAVERQAAKLQGLTEQWLETPEDGPSGAPPHDIRWSLLRAHLEQIQALLPQSRGDDGDAGPRAHGHVSIALELLQTLENKRGPAPRSERPDPFLALSEQERRVATRLVAGQSNKEIGFELGIASTTVSTHRKRILDKLGVATLPELVRLAMQAGSDS